MSHPIRSRLLGVVCAGMLASTLLSESGANAQVATFENFPEGFVGDWFVDPFSGIIFTNAVWNFPDGTFSIDYAGTTNPPILPGHYLTGSGYSPGPQGGATAGFGFTCILPTPSTDVQMDEYYYADSNFFIGIIGYSTNGLEVVHTNIQLPGTWPYFAVAHSVCVSRAAMGRVVVTTPSNTSVGFDNIGTPPVIRSISVSNQVVVLTANYTRPQSQLLSSTNLSTWSAAGAEVTNNSGAIRFTVPAVEPRMYFRLQQ